MKNMFSNFSRVLATAFSLGAGSTSATQASADSNKDQDSETFVLEPTSPFSEIAVSSIMSVEVVLGKALGITLTCPAHLKSKIDIGVRGSRLTVDTIGNFHHRGNSEISVRIETPTLLRKASTDGASTLTLRDVLGSDAELSSNGASTLKAYGRCEMLRLRTDGAAKVNTVNVNSASINARAEGASSLKFKAGAAKSDAIAEGAASITVHGKSPVSRLRASGAASVKEKA